MADNQTTILGDDLEQDDDRERKLRKRVAQWPGALIGGPEGRLEAEIVFLLRRLDAERAEYQNLKAIEREWRKGPIDGGW